jgi:hypothetical protein
MRRVSFRFAYLIESFRAVFFAQRAVDLRSKRRLWNLWDCGTGSGRCGRRCKLLEKSCLLIAHFGVHSSTLDFLRCFLDRFRVRNEGRGVGVCRFRKDPTDASHSIVRREAVIICKAD